MSESEEKETALFSRTVGISPMGKCTKHFTIELPEEVEEALIGMAFSKGTTKGAYVRDVLMNHLYGVANMARLHHKTRPD
jgi:hypothetical protein